MGSLRDEQFKYLFEAKKQIEAQDGNDKGGFKGILEDLCHVFVATNDKQKYFHLFHLLAQEPLSLVEMPPAISDKLYPEVKKGISALIKEKIKVTKDITSCEIIMLQPASFTATDKETAKKRGYDLETIRLITFADVVACLNELKSPFADIFARYVASWAPRDDCDTSYLSGAIPPEKLMEP